MKYLSILLLVILSCCTAEARKFIVPPFLHQGDTVAIISPASYLGQISHMRADSILRSWGLVPVRSGKLPEKEYRGAFSGTDEERVADLKWAFENPNIKAVICARGGYGMIRILDDIPLSVYRKNPKWFSGFSDITNAHCQMNAAKVMSIHGAMYTSFRKKLGQDSTCLLMRDIMMGHLPEYHIAPNPMDHQGKVKGRLVGGNLSCFAPLIGTKYDPTQIDDGVILFLEEVDESYHSIDRMMNLLKLHGALENVKGVIVGDFTSCTKDIDYNSVNEMLDTYFKPLNIPVCYGFPAGHDKVNLPLIEGATVNMQVSSKGTDISFELK